MKPINIYLIIVFSCIAGLISGIILSTLLQDCYEKESNLNNKNQFNESNLLNSGWHKECLEYEIITYDRFLVKIGDRGVVGLEYSYNPNAFGRPKLINETYILESSRNETICVKEILVKNTSFGGGL